MAIVQDRRGDLIITGRTTTLQTSIGRPFLLKIGCTSTRILQVLWTYLYDITTYSKDEFAKSLVLDKNGNIIINGPGFLPPGISASSGKEGTAFMISIDQNGQNINWSNKYFDLDYVGTEFNHLDNSHDGGLFATGSAWILKSTGSGGRLKNSIPVPM